jgi:hypothetical protein
VGEEEREKERERERERERRNHVNARSKEHEGTLLVNITHDARLAIGAVGHCRLMIARVSSAPGHWACSVSISVVTPGNVV